MSQISQMPESKQLLNDYQNDKQNEQQHDIVKEINQNHFKYFSLFSSLGLLNNFGYVVVTSSAQNLAEHFNQQNIMSTFSLCLILFASLSIIFNQIFLYKTTHQYRIRLVALFQFFSFLSIGIGNFTTNQSGFYLALFGTILQGISSALGEVTILGFQKVFPPFVISGWSSGTGLAGILGTIFCLGMSSLNVPESYTFIILCPLVPCVYLTVFTKLDSIKKKFRLKSEIISQTIINKEGDDNENKAQENMQMNVKNIIIVFPKVFYYAINIGLVYYFEYVILSSFADRAHQKGDSQDYFEKHAYEIINLCYQLGVFISRSSITLIRIKKIHILTILQLINCLLWFYIGLAVVKDWNDTNFYMNTYFHFINMIWVGLMGGASYVNTYDQIIYRSTLQKIEKELSIGICTIMNNIFILSSSITALIFSNTFMK